MGHVVCKSVVTFVLLVAASAVVPAQSGGFQVSGAVITTAGDAVVGAAVTLVSGGGAQKTVTARTDAEGRFLLLAPLSGPAVLTVTALGLSPAEVDVQVPSAGAPVLPPLSIVMADIVRERVNVVGDGTALTRAPGSMHVINRTELQRLQTTTEDVHRMLRQIPGLNIQEEDGYGLRPNIGMRGTGTDRSAKITMMEDGILIAPAPYAAPAAYYAPTPGRMEAIEVRKGSSQIKSGPITTGGVLNYVSTSIPADFRLRTTLASGADSTRKIVASLGDTYTNAGWLVETYQFRTDGFKQLDGGGNTGVDVADYLAKFKVNTTPTETLFQELEFKLGRTTQAGQETYLGLTDADFAATPLRRYAASQLDEFTSTHQQYQVRHLLARPTWDVTTVAYHNDFTRAWYKLESVMGTSLSAVLASPATYPQQFDALRGGATAANALVIRNNNRTYFGRGVQSTLGARFTTGAIRHSLEAGLRYHEDEEDRFQQDDAYQMVAGRMVRTRAGAPGSQTNQVVGASALAAFIAHTAVTGRWTFTPGLRMELIDLRRTDYARTDPARSAPTAQINTSVDVLIPGLGIAYRLRPSLTVFGGTYKGFAPPGPGSAAETKSEDSLNYEIGSRWQRDTAQAEVVAFFSDYANLLGRDMLSTGGTGTGEIYNGGAARVRGLEVSGLWRGLRAAYTFTETEFRNAFQSQYGPWGTVQVGDRLPYAPRHQVFVALDLGGPRWHARVDASAVGRMRTVAGQGALADRFATDPTLTFGASADYSVLPKARLFASVQNLFNSATVVSRHPAGVRPVAPRLIMVGLNVELGR